jgi:hypothetical protein
VSDDGRAYHSHPPVGARHFRPLRRRACLDSGHNATSAPHRIGAVLGTADHEVHPHAAIYFSPKLPSVHLIAKPGVEAVVSHTLQILNYRLGRHSPIDASPATLTENESSIVIFDGSIEGIISAVKNIYPDTPTILMTNESSIQLRVLCARANIDAVVLVADVKTELIEWIE